MQPTAWRATRAGRRVLAATTVAAARRRQLEARALGLPPITRHIGSGAPSPWPSPWLHGHRGVLTRTAASPSRAVAAVSIRREFATGGGSDSSRGDVGLGGLDLGSLAGALAGGSGGASADGVSADDLLREPHSHGFDRDLIVIGGGSGGISCARNAGELGADVMLLDAVDPSPQGSTWGLGGTCVNVGCIPKKLFHNASLLGHALDDAHAMGWRQKGDATKDRHSAEWEHDWDVLRTRVADHISSLNWGYRGVLMDSKVKYTNAKGRIVDPHTVAVEPIPRATGPAARVQPHTVTAKHILIAVGGRPRVLDIPGAEHCITSDDVFTLTKPPGRTLVVGASYIALETAGFLTGLGYDVTVLARSVLLRGFDTQMAGLIGHSMERAGTRFVIGQTPSAVERDEATGRLHVTWAPSVSGSGDDNSGGGASSGGATTETFDTVMFAIGRDASTRFLGLDDVGVATDEAGKVVAAAASGRDTERSSVDSIFAVGDVLSGRPELTPVAIRAGKLLAERLFGESAAAMDYASVATCVYTPLEYGSVGMSEDDAIAKLGEDGVEVYHSAYDTLEMAATAPVQSDKFGHMPAAAACYSKAVCDRASGRVLGVHVLGPMAGDVIQGFALAVKLGATKADLDACVGIHPTHAEELVLLQHTKRSGVDHVKTSC